MNRLICDHCHPFCDRPKDRLPSLTYPDTPVCDKTDVLISSYHI